jgi:high affinity sulfate transporter 1
MLYAYKREDLRFDVQAGISVAAVAVPVGIAYSQLAGFSPVVGLYSTILGMVGYALFGSSRQLIVGPDAATCALVAATLLPLAHGDDGKYATYSVALTFLTGLFCIVASRLRLGVLADFLSRPILSGFLNGIALSIIFGQLGKLLGFSLTEDEFISRLIETVQRLPETHWPTLAIAVVTIASHWLTKRFLPRLPAVLVAMVVATLLVVLFRLDQHGVAVVGSVPAGLPHMALPRLRVPDITHLVFSAAGIALVSFSSATLTTRSFAVKNGYEVDTDRELAALGAANIGSALLGGFAISGADSRTATNDAAGGRTQLVSIVGAGAVAATLLFLTTPLAYVPTAALGAVLFYSGFSLIDLTTMRWLYRVSKNEFALAVVTLLGVLLIGVIDAILIAVLLALFRFIRLTARPKLFVLGHSEGVSGWRQVSLEEGLAVQPGVLVLRFDGPLVFFNAPHFKQQVLSTVSHAEGIHWLMLDMLPVTRIDITGLTVLFELNRSLRALGIQLALAGRIENLSEQMQRRGISFESEQITVYPTLNTAVREYRLTQIAQDVKPARARPASDAGPA